MCYYVGMRTPRTKTRWVRVHGHFPRVKCERCKALFIPKRSDNIFCRPKCGTKASEARTGSRKIHRRQSNLRARYGMEVAEYEILLDAQKGKCSLCKEIPPKRRLAVDHCHTTQVFRGLLCSRCNLMLGYAQDSPERLRSAAAYIETMGQRVA
jgi:hypothetical protein